MALAQMKRPESLASEAEDMIPLRNTLTEMAWPQPPSSVQIDNSTAIGVTNKTMVTKMLKSMDMRASGGSDAATTKTTFATTGH